MALYADAHNEVKTDYLFFVLRKCGISVLFPKVQGRALSFYKVEALHHMKQGFYSMSEPQTGKKVPLKNIDLMVVPGVIFDTRGYRLGYGKGYYDRTLQRVKGMKIGFAFDFQMVSHVPNEKHDRSLDMIITDKKTYKVGQL